MQNNQYDHMDHKDEGIVLTSGEAGPGVEWILRLIAVPKAQPFVIGLAVHTDVFSILNKEYLWQKN